MTNASEKSTLSNADLGVSPTMKEDHGARPSVPELLKPNNDEDALAASDTENDKVHNCHNSTVRVGRRLPNVSPFLLHL